MLERTIREKQKYKDLLLMTHLVVGYPTLSGSREMVGAMVEAGVDLVELQIPFSEPVADGPVILRANHEALKAGVRVEQCLAFASEMAKAYPIPFLIMTYYNIPFQYGLERFAQALAEAGISGSIIADLPPEEADEYLAAMDPRGLARVFILSPETGPSRMARIGKVSKGFVYCAARAGVTGEKTRFSADTVSYLARCREATGLPTAVGFGVRERADLDFLRGKADIAVIGTGAIRAMEQGGPRAVYDFLAGLHQA